MIPSLRHIDSRNLFCISWIIIYYTFYHIYLSILSILSTFILRPQHDVMSILLLLTQKAFFLGKNVKYFCLFQKVPIFIIFFCAEIKCFIVANMYVGIGNVTVFWCGVVMAVPCRDGWAKSWIIRHPLCAGAEEWSQCAAEHQQLVRYVCKRLPKAQLIICRIWIKWGW